MTPINPIVLVVGGANRDEVAQLIFTPVRGQSNPVHNRATWGGVGRNLAVNLAALGADVRLLTVVGDDLVAEGLLADARDNRVDVSWVLRRNQTATGRYAAVMDSAGDLLIGLADMAAIESLSADELVSNAGAWRGISAVVAETNLAPQTLGAAIKMAKAQSVPVFLDLVSPEKARRLPARIDGVELVSCNRQEAAALDGVDAPAAALAQKIVERGAASASVSDRADDLVYCTQTTNGRLPVPQAQLVDVTGAGDALFATIIFQRLSGADIKTACKAGLEAARLMVQSTDHSLSPRDPAIAASTDNPTKDPTT